MARRSHPPPAALGDPCHSLGLIFPREAGLVVSRTPSWDRWLLLSDCLQSQGWGVHFPEQPAEGTAEPKTGHGRGWASDPGIEILEAHHLNCFRKMLRFRLFLESRKVICKTPPSRQYLEGGHGALSEPRPHPYLLGLLPGRGHRLLLGFGRGEGEEPLDAGEVGLHHLGVGAAQRCPHGAAFCW